VPFDYHIKAGDRLYSVPYGLVGQKVEIRLSASVVEIYHSGQRVASHKRAFGEGPPSTDPEHMPSSHRAYAEWTPERIIAWANEFGGPVAAFCDNLMARRAHPEQGFRSCIGVIQLAKKYGPSNLAAACGKANRLRSFNYRTVSSILKNNLQDRPDPATTALPEPRHENIRGAAYYLN
jgi:transposase